MFEDIFENVTGTVRQARVYDPNGITPPRRMIQTDDAWEVKTRWFIDGAGAPYLGGEWTVHLYAEAYGPGKDAELAKAELDLDDDAKNPDPTVLPREYKHTFKIPAFDDKPLESLAPGVYKLVTVVNYTHEGVPLEMAGFREGPTIQIYEEGN